MIRWNGSILSWTKFSTLENPDGTAAECQIANSSPNRRPTDGSILPASNSSRQFAQPAAYRANWRNLIPSAIPVFWNLEK